MIELVAHHFSYDRSEGRVDRAFKKFCLKGKTAFITGGGTGLGYYMARGLMLSGARVMIAARREAVLKKAVARLTAEVSEGAISYALIDLGDSASIVEAAQQAVNQLGGVDIFVGNAGNEGKAFVHEDQVILADVMQVNFSANVMLLKYFVPRMQEKKWGRILFSSSETSIRGLASGRSIYAASKGALNSYARMAAIELGHDGITVNSLIIGFFLTEMLQTRAVEHSGEDESASAGVAQKHADNTAVGRIGNPAEIEGLVQLLASEAGSFITGSELLIDGGTSIMMRPNPINKF